MKKHLLFIALLLSIASQATHQRVIELIYDHVQGTNKYIFTVFVQLEPGVPMTNQVIESNSPANTIPLVLTADLPLSGPCTTQRRLHVYQTDTVDLGPIPVNGYSFAYNTCCRQVGLDNVANSSANAFYVEVKMLPEPNQSYASSSPRFLNPPIEQSLQNSPFVLRQPAFDPDGDSIYYALIDARTGDFQTNTSVSYNSIIAATGTAPLGLAYPVSINQSLGEFTAASAMLGYYVFAIQAQSYNNGVLTSTITRDILISAQPTPPSFPAISLSNFSSNGSSLANTNGIYSTTIKVGDSISFDVSGTASDSLYLASASQLYTLSAHTAGNCQSNCADFDASPNLAGLVNANGHFGLLADSTHLIGGDTTTYRISFLVASQDNSCTIWQFANLFVDITIVNPQNIGIAEHLPSDISIFPNPSNGIFEFPMSDHPNTFEVFTLLGQRVYNQQLEPSVQTINLSHLPKGSYILVRNKQQRSTIIIE